MNTCLLIIPAASALTGFLFNHFCGRYIIGTYLPSKKMEIAAAISKKVNTFLPFDQIEAKITSPALIEKTMPMIEAHIDEFLSVKLPQEIPMLAMFVGNKTTDKIKEVFVNQLKALFPKVMTNIVGDFKASLNLEAGIKAEIEKADIAISLKAALTAPLRKFSYAGMLLGLLLGVLNLALFYWLA